jgi:tetratricopeptide (TPR) repeat protein
MAVAIDSQLVEGYIHLASISSSMNKSLGFLSEQLGYLSDHTSITDSTWIWLKRAYALDQVQGLIGFGRLYTAIGNSPAAVQCYNEVLSLRPWHTDALLNKAIIFGHMDQPDSSQKYLSLVEKLDPTNPQLAYQKIGNISLMIHKYLLHNDYAGFYEVLTRYFEDDHQSINYRMGIAYLFGQRFTDAEKYYRISGYRDMDVGLLLLETGRLDSGRLLLEQALDLRYKLKDRVFVFDIARIHAALGKNDEAVHYFRKTIASGFKDIGWFSHDPFIDYIRDDPKFKSVFSELLDENDRMLKRIKELENQPFDLDQLIP